MGTASDRLKNIMNGIPASGGSGQWPSDAAANGGQKLVPSIPKTSAPDTFGKRTASAIRRKKPGEAGPTYG